MAQTPSQRVREPLQIRGRDAAFRFSSLELILLPVALLIAGFVGYSVYARVTDLDAAPNLTPTTSVPAFRTNLSTTIQANGTVQATQQVNLNFGASGKITAIEVAAGTRVVAGQVLARLDDSQLQAALRSAQTNLASAQARLDSAISPSAADTSSALASIATATNNVTSAEKALSDLRAKPTPTDLASAQQAVLSAQNGLQSAQDALTNAQKAVTKAQDDVALAQSDLDTAWDNLRRAQGELEDAEDACAAAPGTPGLPSKGSRAPAAPFVSATLNCPSLQTYKAAVSAYTSAANAYNGSITALATKQDAVVTAQNSLNNGNLMRSIENAQLGLQTARQKQTDTMAGATALEIAQAEASLATAKASLTSAQERYNDLINPTQDVILPLQSSVEQATQSLKTAEENLANAVITAPFDGTITVVNGQVGGQASGGSTQASNAASAVMVLVNPNLIRIDASIDQTDIAKLKVGQQARITFDALAGTTYTALVSTVGLTPTTSSGVVTYLVSFGLDTSRLASGTAIPSPGMSASITVTIESASNALVVPSRSIQGSGANATVRLKTEDGEEARRVTTGLTNGTLTQVTAGLEEGDEVVYTVTASTTTSTGTQQRQQGQFQGGQFPGGGQFIPGGGGGPVAGGGGVR